MLIHSFPSYSSFFHGQLMPIHNFHFWACWTRLRASLALTIDINDNFQFDQQSPPLSLMAISILFLLPPLSSCYSPYHDALSSLSSPPVFYLPLWHQWQRECPLMILCLVLWGGNHSQFMSEILKGPTWQRFSEDVCNLLLCLNIFQLDVPFCYLFS